MRMPSIKTLSQIPGADAKALRTFLTMDYAELRKHEAAQARIRECYNPPKKYDVRMHVLNVAAGTHGLEAMESVSGEYADYLNAGDTYVPTVIYWRGNFRVQSMGDFIESMERQGIYQTWNH